MLRVQRVGSLALLELLKQTCPQDQLVDYARSELIKLALLNVVCRASIPLKRRHPKFAEYSLSRIKCTHVGCQNSQGYVFEQGKARQAPTKLATTD